MQEETACCSSVRFRKSYRRGNSVLCWDTSLRGEFLWCLSYLIFSCLAFCVHGSTDKQFMQSCCKFTMCISESTLPRKMDDSIEIEIHCMRVYYALKHRLIHFMPLGKNYTLWSVSFNADKSYFTVSPYSILVPLNTLTSKHLVFEKMLLKLSSDNCNHYDNTYKRLT